MFSQSNNIDLTKGSIHKKLMLFLLPIIAGNFFQQLYTTVDAIIVGQFTGKVGLAAIDSIYNLLRLPISFFVGLSTGATIIISQYYGANKRDALVDAVHTTFAFALIGGTFLSLTGIALAPFALQMLKIPADIFADTLSYVRIYFAGFVIAMLYNLGAGILRAVGDSKTPFYYLIIASTVNIILDLIFVGLLKWGVTGAALATLLSQLVSALLIIKNLINTTKIYKIFISKIRINCAMLKSTLVIGLPIALQSALYPIANMMIQTNINRLGTNSIAAWALCGKLDFLIWLIVDSTGITIATFSAQNYGAKQFKRLQKGMMISGALAVTIILFISIILYHWTIPISKLFINTDDYTILLLSDQLMKFLAPYYFICIFSEILSGTIRGTGETVKPMIITLICTFGVRIIWTIFIIPLNPTLIIIIGNYPITWLMTSIAFAMYYYLFFRHKLKGDLKLH